MIKHIVLTNGRSGSNYVTNLLNAHPHIVNFGEVLGPWTLPYKLHSLFNLGGDSDLAYLDYIFTNPNFFYGAQIYSAWNHIRHRRKINFKIRKNVRSIGVKDFSINFCRKNLSDFLRRNKHFYVINLYRENQLKRLLSLEMMRANKIISVRNRKENKSRRCKPKITKIKLDPSYIIEQLSIFQSEIDDQMHMIKDHPPERLLTIKYEDFFASDISLNRYQQKIFNLLKVSPIAFKSEHKKILSNKVSDILANYSEVKPIINNTQFKSFIDQ